MNDLNLKTKIKFKWYDIQFKWYELKQDPIIRLLFMPITIPIGLSLFFLSFFYKDKDG